MCNAISGVGWDWRGGHHGKSAQVDGTQPRCAALEIENEGRHDLEADSSARLLGIDVAVEGLPAARPVEFEIVRLAE